MLPSRARFAPVEFARHALVARARERAIGRRQHEANRICEREVGGGGGQRSEYAREACSECGLPGARLLDSLLPPSLCVRAPALRGCGAGLLLDLLLPLYPCVFAPALRERARTRVASALEQGRRLPFARVLDLLLLLYPCVRAPAPPALRFAALTSTHSPPAPYTSSRATRTACWTSAPPSSLSRPTLGPPPR